MVVHRVTSRLAELVSLNGRDAVARHHPGEEAATALRTASGTSMRPAGAQTRVDRVSGVQARELPRIEARRFSS